MTRYKNERLYMEAAITCLPEGENGKCWYLCIEDGDGSVVHESYEKTEKAALKAMVEASGWVKAPKSGEKPVEKKPAKKPRLFQQALSAGCLFFERKSYEVLETEWRCPSGEADIIAMQDGVLVFANVMVRRDTDKGLPKEVNIAGARERMERIAVAYLVDRPELADIAFRFDVLSMLAMGKDRIVIQHRLGAYSAGE